MKRPLICTWLCFYSLLAMAQDNLKYVDPLIGNVSQLLVPTRPTIHLPNQVIRMYPDREDYRDDQIRSFPLTIVSHRLGQVFSIKPATAIPDATGWNEQLTYDHDLEITRPWYYSTWLIDKDIKVEFTPAEKSAIYRFGFPRAVPQILLLGTYNRGAAAFYKLEKGNILTGMETYHSNIKVYLYGVFSAPGSMQVLENRQLVNKEMIEGQNIKALIKFSSNNPVEFRYAISYVSAEQAYKNFKKEIAPFSFDAVSKKGEQAWSKVINQIQVEGGTEAQRRSFYTSLYRCYERMINISEDSSYFSGYDNKIHHEAQPFYVDDWSWDTYLAHHPLRTILNPQQESDMLRSYVKMYEQSGWMPTFPVLFGDHACMNGFHSTVTFLDAYRKGLKGFDIQKAFAGSLKNADEATMIPWRNGDKDELTVFYHNKGYFPSLNKNQKETVREVHPFEKRQAVAVTLGGSYDDWALGELAKELGKNSEHNRFSKRALNYKNLWENNKRFFMPKDSAGNWVAIDPALDGGKGGREYYDENNGWTYLWQVQHDIKGLIELMGGNKSFEERLDDLFRQGLGRGRHEFWYDFPDATGLVGQFSMGNEPSFHIPYLYNYAGAAWKTQKRIRFLLDLWFKDNVFGIPGDEDGGGMTAFVVFSSMGFYPVTPGLPVYSIGSPVFSKVSIALHNGKTFTVIANKSSAVNKYIQRAKMNGVTLNSPFFTHNQLLEGGKLELEMGPLPNKQWGNEKAF